MSNIFVQEKGYSSHIYLIFHKIQKLLISLEQGIVAYVLAYQYYNVTYARDDLAFLLSDYYEYKSLENNTIFNVATKHNELFTK